MEGYTSSLLSINICTHPPTHTHARSRTHTHTHTQPHTQTKKHIISLIENNLLYESAHCVCVRALTCVCVWVCCIYSWMSNHGILYGNFPSDLRDRRPHRVLRVGPHGIWEASC